jgi:hypothetical protein
MAGMALPSDKRAVRAALAAAEGDRERVKALERAIRTHYRRVHAGNWGADDELWAVLGLEAKAEAIG